MNAEYTSYISPTPAPRKEDVQGYNGGDFMSRASTAISHLSLAFPWVLSGCELAAILALVLPLAPSDAILSALFPRAADPVSAARQLSVHPIFLLGMSLLCCGAILRKTCYRTLGRHFTFKLTILKEHELVTWGPYAIVRHPSYTSIMVATVGVFVMGLSPGSWLAESRIIDTFPGRAVVGAYMVWYMFMTFGFLRRMRIEDAVLREEFGAQWDEWARKVPYLLVPYVW
ncbi:hypothetical protein PYCCODRAFT_1373391 [Trametes coccinea BRFM310]|uniref:Protein-S-isoprenylcysteine O-methyltransferase n=1 Tax=Trametes coccinea (strain BRFM310) TaxID=1353009 RepID=A0A1Y2IDP5_TRAC3|nr:hypothetical protein PYCCODRAFT_1373391 [Trametes coccinea BRFM310]